MNWKEKISKFASSFEGKIGIAYCNPLKKERFSIKGKVIFPAASIIKIPVLVEFLRQAEKGRLSLAQKIKIKKEEKAGGAGVLKELHDGLELTYLDLAKLMIVISDNTATNILIDAAGMGRVNEMMRSIGLKKTVLGRKMMVDPKALHTKNYVTPDETAFFLEELLKGNLLSKEYTDIALDILLRQQFREKIPRFFPDDVGVAGKIGEISGVRHDAGIVFHPKGAYILCVFTMNVKDEWKADETIGKISKIIYEAI